MHAETSPHRSRLGLMIVTLLATLAVGACGQGVPADRPAVTTKPAGRWDVAPFPEFGVSFRHPASWTTSRYDLRSSFSSLVTYVGTRPVGDPCVTRKVRVATETVCAWPRSGPLAPGGVIAAWSSVGYPSRTLADQAGVATTLGGYPAKVLTQRNGAGCGVARTGRHIQASIGPSASARRFFTVEVCTGPGSPPETLEEVQAMLASIRLT